MNSGMDGNGSWRSLIGLAVVTGALAILVALLLWFPDREKNGENRFRDGNAADIQTVEIENQRGAFTVRAADGGYIVHDIPAALVDYGRFSTMMEACANLRAIRRVDGSTAGGVRELAEYGLDPPAAEVRVEFDGGPPLAFRVGRMEIVTGCVYFTVNGEDDIYMMEGRYGACFTGSPKDYITRAVTEPLVLSSPLSALLDVSFSGEGVAESFTVRSVASGNVETKREALSFGAVTHLVNAGGLIAELDQTEGIAALGALIGITALDIEAYNCTPEQITAFGLDDPRLRVSFDIMNNTEGVATPLTLDFVPVPSLVQPAANSSGSGKPEYLVRRNGEDIVFRVTELPFMRLNPRRLMTRWYLTPLIMDLGGLRVTAGEHDLDFSITGKSGSVLAVTLGGRPLDVELFRKLHRLLVSANREVTSLERRAAENTAADAVAPMEIEPVASVEYRS